MIDFREIINFAAVIRDLVGKGYDISIEISKSKQEPDEDDSVDQTDAPDISKEFGQ